MHNKYTTQEMWNVQMWNIRSGRSTNLRQKRRKIKIHNKSFDRAVRRLWVQRGSGLLAEEWKHGWFRMYFMMSLFCKRVVPHLRNQLLNKPSWLVIVCHVLSLRLFLLEFVSHFLEQRLVLRDTYWASARLLLTLLLLSSIKHKQRDGMMRLFLVPKFIKISPDLEK